MANDRYNQPTEGEPDWHVPLNENFADLGIEVTNEVDTFDDLPAPDSNATSSDGNPRRYLVRDSRIVYRDTGSGWEPIAGLGSASGSVPGTSYFEEVDVDRAVINSELTWPDGSTSTARPDSSSDSSGGLSKDEYVITQTNAENKNLSQIVAERGEQGWFYLESGSIKYMWDGSDLSVSGQKIPTGVHIRGKIAQSVTVTQPDPKNQNLKLRPNSSIGNVSLETSNSPGGTADTSGQSRQIGVYNNLSYNEVDPAYWERQPLVLNSGGDGKDHPTFAARNEGGNGDAAWFMGNGPAIVRFHGPSAQNTTRAFMIEDESFNEIGYWNFKGHLYLGAATPRILMNAPSKYAGSHPAQEQLNVLSMRTESEDSTDALSLNQDVARNYSDLGPGAGEIIANVSGGKPFRIADPVDGRSLFGLESQDLTGSSAPTPSENDLYATHDGSGSAPRGLYRSDSSNAQWVKVEDNSVVISY